MTVARWTTHLAARRTPIGCTSKRLPFASGLEKNPPYDITPGALAVFSPDSSLQSPASPAWPVDCGLWTVGQFAAGNCIALLRPRHTVHRESLRESGSGLLSAVRRKGKNPRPSGRPTVDTRSCTTPSHRTAFCDAAVLHDSFKTHTALGRVPSAHSHSQPRPAHKIIPLPLPLRANILVYPSSAAASPLRSRPAAALRLLACPPQPPRRTRPRSLAPSLSAVSSLARLAPASLGVLTLLRLHSCPSATCRRGSRTNSALTAFPPPSP